MTVPAAFDAAANSVKIQLKRCSFSASIRDVYPQLFYQKSKDYFIAVHTMLDSVDILVLAHLYQANTGQIKACPIKYTHSFFCNRSVKYNGNDNKQHIGL